MSILHAPEYLELARYTADGSPCQGVEPGCMGYVVEPPAPAILLVPFVLLFGVGLNQVPVAMGVGAVAMGLFWIATRRLGWSLSRSAAITVLLALGTGFWWAAGDGSIWTFSHVSSVLFMMAALVEATGRRRPFLVGLLVGLAGLCRLPTFLGFPFFLYLTVGGGDDIVALVRSRAARRTAGQFGVGMASTVALLLLYNLARFHTIADRGYDHPQYEGGQLYAHGQFSIDYIPRELAAIFPASPTPNEDSFPFFTPSVFGMALLLVTPAFLYAFIAVPRGVKIAAAVSVGLVAIPHLLYAADGFAQFGYRYSLDYLPMLGILTASGMGPRPGVRAWLAIGLSVAVAIWGPLYFSDTPLESWGCPGNCDRSRTGYSS